MIFFKPTSLRFRLFAGLIMAFSTTGCALMSSGKAPALYAFGATSDFTAPSGESSAQVTFIYAGSSFERQIADTRILTENGNSVAFIADTRWVAPASELFDSALIRKFETTAPSVRIIDVGDRPNADYLLSVDMRRFSAVYSRGVEQAPDVILEGRASLVRLSDRSVAGDWHFEHRETVAANRVADIVASLDRGTDAVLEEIATHANIVAQEHAGE